MHSTLFVLASGLALASAAGPLDGYPVPGTTGKLGNAAVETGEPLGAVYTATLPDSDTTGIRGFVSGATGPGGVGVFFTVSLSGFPSPSLGPFCTCIPVQAAPLSVVPPATRP